MTPNFYVIGLMFVWTEHIEVWS